MIGTLDGLAQNISYCKKDVSWVLDEEIHAWDPLPLEGKSGHALWLCCRKAVSPAAFSLETGNEGRDRNTNNEPNPIG
jgi:hypothetical protein